MWCLHSLQAANRPAAPNNTLMYSYRIHSGEEFGWRGDGKKPFPAGIVRGNRLLLFLRPCVSGSFSLV